MGDRACRATLALPHSFLSIGSWHADADPARPLQHLHDDRLVLHLKGGAARPLLLVILISWGIALIEYCLAVPANRIGYAQGWSGGQLKIAQECLALLIFGLFMVLVLKEPIGWRHLGAFACIIGAAGFMFAGR